MIHTATTSEQIFSSMSAESKVWVYQSDRAFTKEESLVIGTSIQAFVDGWVSHKEEVAGAGKLLYNHFVVLMADESKTGVSGCSIDSSVRFVKDLQQQFQVNFFNRFNIAWMENGEVKSASKDVFEGFVRSGAISDETVVFNNTITTKADFDTKWKIPFRESWMKRFFSV
jgi:hypothetical protein